MCARVAAEPRRLFAVLTFMTEGKPADPTGPDPIQDQAIMKARLYDEQTRAAGASEPGMRAPLPPGSLDKRPTDPQGDENREPPPGAPLPPPDAVGSQPTVKPGLPRRTDPAGRAG